MFYFTTLLLFCLDFFYFPVLCILLCHFVLDSNHFVSGRKVVTLTLKNEIKLSPSLFGLLPTATLDNHTEAKDHSFRAMTKLFTHISHVCLQHIFGFYTFIPNRKIGRREIKSHLEMTAYGCHAPQNGMWPWQHDKEVFIYRPKLPVMKRFGHAVVRSTPCFNFECCFSWLQKSDLC